MTSRELIKKYIAFFVSKGHIEIPGASLVPENDPSALFTSAGMHPLVPFLMGEEHPAGQKLVNVQKCLRTQDIDEVGNPMHNTFFLMLGNWSLGDPEKPDGIGAGYFKEEAIGMSWEFLTKELKLSPDRISVTVFAGDKNAPRDEESAVIWKKIGLPDERIYFLPKEDNWWGPIGETGPCGPDSEMFYDTGKDACGPDCRPGCHCGKYFEIWNNVFMEFNRRSDETYEPLKQKNVDTGMGVERTVAMLQGKDDVYKTELFEPLIRIIEGISNKSYQEEKNRKPMRIMADHTRAAAFIIADGVVPSNVEQGYILRKLIRRAVDQAARIGYTNYFGPLLEKVINIYESNYPELDRNRNIIYEIFEDEESKYSQTIKRARNILIKMGEKIKLKDVVTVKKDISAKARIVKKISGKEAFNLFSTYGLSPQQLKGQGYEFNQEEFNREFKEHQELSRRGAAKKFSGGLADQSEVVTKYHTATHLLHAALRQVLGEQVQQKGSNITPERLRFDFSHPEKLTAEQIKQVEDLVNQKIKENLPVKMETMSLAEAQKQGALAFFGQKYGDQVKVYCIGDFSKEVCGGPHVESTGELGKFKILKEKSVGRGLRRIRATLSP